MQAINTSEFFRKLADALEEKLDLARTLDPNFKNLTAIVKAAAVYSRSFLNVELLPRPLTAKELRGGN